MLLYQKYALRFGDRQLKRCKNDYDAYWYECLKMQASGCFCNYGWRLGRIIDAITRVEDVESGRIDVRRGKR
jgi:hypothetical protein